MKSIYPEELYLTRGRNWIDGKQEMHSINNGNKVDFSAGKSWKCIDVTIDDRYYNLSLLLEDINGEQLVYSIDNLLKSDYFIISKRDADKYLKQYGKENFDRILSGKVKIGMTKDMCTLSWGEPKKINETITSGKKSEQWVYENNYLYFDNGILSAIQ